MLPVLSKGQIHHSRGLDLRDCMEAISERQKEALSLAYFEGFTHSEIASTLGIETSAVKSRIRKALAGLRRCLGNEQF